MEIMRGIIVNDLVSLDLKGAYLGFDLDRRCIQKRAAADFQLDEDIVNITIYRQVGYGEVG